MIDLDHIQIDDLLYPNIQIDDSDVYNELVKCSNLRSNYLHERKPQRYMELLFTGNLTGHCADMEQITFFEATMHRTQYLERPTAPLMGINWIQAFAQAQTVDELHYMIMFITKIPPY